MSVRGVALLVSMVTSARRGVNVNFQTWIQNVISDMESATVNLDSPVNTVIKPVRRVLMDLSARRSVFVRIIQPVIMHLVIVIVYPDFKERFVKKLLPSSAPLFPVAIMATRPNQAVRQELVPVQL